MNETLASIEHEIVALLSMSPETLDELSGMFVEEDESELARIGGSVQDGLMSSLERLRKLGLVRQDDQCFWWLTQHGEAYAAESVRP